MGREVTMKINFSDYYYNKGLLLDNKSIIIPLLKLTNWRYRVHEKPYIAT